MEEHGGLGRRVWPDAYPLKSCVYTTGFLFAATALSVSGQFKPKKTYLENHLFTKDWVTQSTRLSFQIFTIKNITKP